PHREHARLAGRGQVRIEPLLLRRAHRGRDARVVAVQYDDVPGAEIVAVVSPGRIVGGGSEVAEVSDGGGARVVVVVAERGVGAGLVAHPGGGVTIRIVRRRPV